MKINEIPYKMEQLDAYGPNELYRKCHKDLLEDFEVVFESFLNQELPEELTEAQKSSVGDQKTALLSAFVSGHLNFANPSSKLFTKFDLLLNGAATKKSSSGLILPDHLVAK